MHFQKRPKIILGPVFGAGFHWRLALVCFSPQHLELHPLQSRLHHKQINTDDQTRAQKQLRG